MEGFIKEIECSLLGEMLTSESVLYLAIQELKHDDFSTLEVRRCFEIILDLFRNGKTIDPLTISNKSENKLSCKKFLVKLLDCVISTAGAKEHIKIVKDASKRRKATEKTNDLILLLTENADIEKCRTQTSEILNAYDDNYDADAVKAIQGFASAYERIGKPKKYYKTGIHKVDEKAKISKGDYIIFGGRPSAGKTAFTLQMLMNIAKEYNTVFFSLETSTDKIYDRLLSNYTNTKLSDLKDGTVTDLERERITRFANDFSKLKLSVVSAAGWTVEQIKSKALQLKAEIIFIDYLGLIKTEGNSQYERTTRISMDLHTMAQRYRLTTVALVQLNRQDGEPDMTSLRDSGQIEQDADVIMLMHRPDEDDNTNRHLIIAKNKEGEVGKVRLYFEGEVQRFTEFYQGG